MTAAPKVVAPYGYDQWGNPLPPPGAENFAPSGSSHYDDDGTLLPAPVNDLIPAHLPPATAPEDPAPVDVPDASYSGGGGDYGGGGMSSGGGDLTAPFTQPFVAPTPQALPDVPTFRAPAYTPPPAFSFGEFLSPGPFVAPDRDAMNLDPGYQGRVKQANDAFLANKAAAQTAHTGGSIKDFLDWNQNQASQEYGNVWNRGYAAYNTNFDKALQTYGTNRAGAVDTYNTNYKTQFADPWQIADTRAQQEFAPQLIGYQTQAANVQHGNDVANSNALNKWYQDYAIFRNQQNDTFDKRFKVETL